MPVGRNRIEFVMPLLRMADMRTTEVNVVHCVFEVIKTISHNHLFFTIRVHVVHVNVGILSPEGRGRINHYVKSFVGNTEIVFPILIGRMTMSLLNLVNDIIIGRIINAEVFILRVSFICSQNFVEGSITIDE